MKKNFKKFTKRDYVAIMVLLLLWAAISYLSDLYCPPQASYIVFLAIMSIFGSFMAYLIRKIGIVTLFYTLGAFFMMKFDGLGLFGQNKLTALFIAGIAFDLLLLFLKTEAKNSAKHIVIGTVFSTALLPVITAYILSGSFKAVMTSQIINMILLSAGIALAGSFLSLLVWSQLRLNKIFLRFEFE